MVLRTNALVLSPLRFVVMDTTNAILDPIANKYNHIAKNEGRISRSEDIYTIAPRDCGIDKLHRNDGETKTALEYDRHIRIATWHYSLGVASIDVG